MSDVQNKNMDSLISSLSDDLGEVKVLQHPFRRVTPWVILALLYTAVVIAAIGVRGDILSKVQDPIFIFELVLVLSMSISAAFSSMWLCVPDVRGKNWLLAIPMTLFGLFLTFLGLKMSMEGFVMPGSHFHSCQLEAMIYGIVPGIALLFLSKVGKTVHPRLQSFMNILAVGGMGYVGLRISCPSDDIAHIVMFHYLPYVFVGIAVVMIGRRFYRW